MRYRLNPNIPITTPQLDFIRIGGNFELGTFPSSYGIEILLRKLASGATKRELIQLADKHNVDHSTVERLIGISGCVPQNGKFWKSILLRANKNTFSLAECILNELERRGWKVILSDLLLPVPDGISLVIDIVNFTPNDCLYQGLMASDIPHIYLIIDVELSILGPLVIPGQTPCMRCVWYDNLDKDPNWNNIHQQLLQRPSTTSIDKYDEWLLALLIGKMLHTVRGIPQEYILKHPLCGQRIVMRNDGPSVFDIAFHSKCSCRFPL